VLILVAAHFAVAALLPAVAKRWGRAAFTVAAIVPAATLVAALRHAPDVAGGGTPVETLSWAPAIGLELTLRLDALALLMILLVAGVGAIVLLFSASYGSPDGAGAGRDSTLLLVFAGAMLGLVLADDVFSLYLFWELTTVCSFLLVGGAGITRASRRSATQALLVTGLGGLAMLLGLILLGTEAGTFRVSEIVADPPSGTVTGVAIVLVLLGALTKSAQAPFHPWLPGAMVAPTPVSAYLHAAAMVKAGVYLVARFAPGFSGLTVWWVPLLVLGVWTMVLGGLRALRQHDLKKLLAFGTVSQLGFLMVLVGAGGRTAATAGAAMVLAHGLFKSALFLVVGVIDHQTGTRDVRELSGLGRRWPLLATAAALAAASMAGVPPLLGFVGKEAAFEAFGGGGARDVLVLSGLVVGSALTVAYSLRFFLGAFGSRPGVAASTAPRPGPGLVGPLLVPVAAGVVLGVVPAVVEPLIAANAETHGTGASYHLALWHGLNLPLLLSAVVLLGGYLVHRHAGVPGGPDGWLPERLHAQTAYRGTVHGLDAVARTVTARLQVGSLPAYLGWILAVVIALPGVALLADLAPVGTLRLYDDALQIPVALLVLVAAATVLRARRRLTAVLLTGVVGYGIGALFLIDGGPDLALAQFLVETLTLVVFVFVLRRFPPEFLSGERPAPGRARWFKAVLAGAGGVVVALMALVFAASRDGLPEVSREYLARAKDDAGALNVVNAIIVDFRAFDTVGEISVLAVAATGAASLILASHRARPRSDRSELEHESEHPEEAR
jgi:multicomponent Na+:H+ antiporter subunit A